MSIDYIHVQSSWIVDNTEKSEFDMWILIKLQGSISGHMFEFRFVRRICRTFRFHTVISTIGCPLRMLVLALIIEIWPNTEIVRIRIQHGKILKIICHSWIIVFNEHLLHSCSVLLNFRQHWETWIWYKKYRDDIMSRSDFCVNDVGLSSSNLIATCAVSLSLSLSLVCNIL